MPNIIEQKGTALLKKKLRELGYDISDSDDKTYDLRVDGKYVEVKTKNKPYTKLDFISLTDKQYAAHKKIDFKIYLVCNVQDERNVEIYEIDSQYLRSIKPKKYTSHEYNKSAIDKVHKKKL